MEKFNGEGNPQSFQENHGERIVISGISGSYHQSNHVKDFSEILYNKVNPVSTKDKHWKYNHPEVPQYVRTVPQIDRFDAQFFGIHYKLAYSMDIMSRKILEHTFQAIYDAGLSQEHLSGKKLGVYIGACFSETEKAAFYVSGSQTEFGIVRCGGVLIQSMKYENLPPLKSNQVTLKTQKFFPPFQSEIIDDKTAIHIFLQIVAENVNKNEVHVIEVKDIVKDLRSIDVEPYDIPGLKVKYELVTKKEFEMENEDIKNIDLMIIENLSNKEKDFTSLLASDAFVLTYNKKSDAPSSRTSSMYRIVSSYETKDAYMSLVRWKPLPIPTSTRTVTVLSNTDLASLLSKRESLSPDEKLLVVTSYPPIDGMKELITQWRCSRRSHIYLVMLNHKIAKDQNSIQVPDLDLAFNVLEHGLWGGVYYVPLAKQQSYGAHSNARLEMEPTGDLRSLHWVETPEPSGGLKIAVRYAALSTIDVKKARGLFKARKDMDCNTFGMDYSGINESGEKVMGIVADESCKKWVTAIPELTWPVPKHWTLEEAATVPLPYALAFYCLVIKTHVAPNGSILVHGAAGSLGQAAISISLALGLEVFATVSEVGKKRFLLRMFPELKEDHIGYSRDYTFGDMVKRVTNGAGVNCILSCVSGQLRNISLKSTKDCGVVIDTVQIPSNEDFSFGMTHMMGCRNYIPVDFSSIFATNNRREIKMLQLLVSEGISRGYVRPLSRVTYASLEAAPALRLLESSRHRGRVMLKVGEAREPAHPRITCSPEQSHVIVSDDELYGLQLAERLVVRGARKLFIHLPKIPTTVITKKRSWEKQGVKAKLITTDISVSKNIYSLLKGCTDVGPIEGIYFVSTVNTKANREKFNGLEVASRKLCTSLKYFAVISADRNFGNRTCISRTRDRLPATKVTISPMKKIDDTDHESIFWRSALDIFESAVRSSDPVIYAKVRAKRNQDLLENIKIISGIKIPENINGATVLNDLGVTNENAPAIAVLLRDEYNILLSEKNILSLSLEKIQEIEQYSKGTELRDIRGLNVFFSHIDSDELMATTGMVFMPTITSNAEMKDDEVDLNQTNLCIVPGMEGNCERFRDLCERIKIPAFVLQPGLDLPNETIQELAERYAKVLLKRTRTSPEIPFYLLGYESGVMVALEMAAILEDRGLTGIVYCIGVAPNEYKKLLDEELKEFNTEIALQDAIVRHMFGLMLGSPCNVDLKDLPWREKVERCLRGLLGRAPFSGQYARAQCDVAYGNIVRVRTYQPSPRALRSRVILLRAKRNWTDDKNLESIPSSKLQQYSQQPIIVHELGVPLAHALKDLRCATYINQNLHPEL